MSHRGRARAPISRRLVRFFLLSVMVVCVLFATAGVAEASSLHLWRGAGGDGKWSTGSNWVQGTAPVNGDSVAFTGAGVATTNDAVTQLGTVTFLDPGFSVAGNPLTRLIELDDQASGVTTWSADMWCTTDTAVSVDNPSAELRMAGDLLLLGSSKLTVQGPGSLTSAEFLSADTGTSIDVASGALRLEGSASNCQAAVTVRNGARLEVFTDFTSETLLVEGGGALIGDGFVTGGIVSGRIEPRTEDSGPATLTSRQPLAMSSDASLTVHVSDAQGAVGVGFSAVSADGLTFAGTPSHPNIVQLVTPPSGALNFNSHRTYTWPIVSTNRGALGDLSGTSVDSSNFRNDLDGGTFALVKPDADTLAVRFTPGPDTHHWTGGGTNDHWSDAANWLEAAAPSSGDGVEFPDSATAVGARNDIADLSITNIRFGSGSYEVSGVPITVGAIAEQDDEADVRWSPDTTMSAESTITNAGEMTLGNLHLANGSTLTCDGSGITRMRGTLDGDGGIRKAGSGTLDLDPPPGEPNTFTGGCYIVGGILQASQDGALGDSDESAVEADGGCLKLSGDITVANEIACRGWGPIDPRTFDYLGSLRSNGDNRVTGSLRYLGGNGSIVNEAGTLDLANGVDGDGATNNLDVEQSDDATTIVCGLVNDGGASSFSQYGGVVVVSGATTWHGQIQASADSTMIVTHPRGLGEFETAGLIGSAELRYDASGTGAWDGTLIGGTTSALDVAGGRLELAGDSGGSFSGQTTVADGALLGMLGEGSLGGELNLKRGGLLYGDGAVSDATIAGTVSPRANGSDPATLTVRGNMTWFSGGHYDCDIAAASQPSSGTAWDRIDVQNALAQSLGTTFTVDFGTPGVATSGFSKTTTYTWEIVRTGSAVTRIDPRLDLDATDFLAANNITPEDGSVELTISPGGRGLAVAYTPASSGYNVTVSTRSATIPYKSTYAIRGTVTDGRGAPVVGAPVALQLSSDGGHTFTDSQAATTGAGGAFDFGAKPTLRTWYRAACTEETTAYSPVIDATPLGKLSGPSLDRVLKGRRYQLSGSYWPRHASGATVTLVRYRLVNHKWHRSNSWSATVRTSGDHNTYQGVVPLQAGQRWRVTAICDAPGNARTGSSTQYYNPRK